MFPVELRDPQLRFRLFQTGPRILQILQRRHRPGLQFFHSSEVPPRFFHRAPRLRHLRLDLVGPQPRQDLACLHDIALIARRRFQ